MLKFILAFIGTLLFSSQTFAQQTDCALSHHTGKYYYISDNDTVLINRTKSTQIESINKGQSKLVLKVTWINNEEFLLTFKKFINFDEKVSCMKKGQVIKVKINQCYADRYTSSYTTDNCGKGFSTFYKLPD